MGIPCCGKGLDEAKLAAAAERRKDLPIVAHEFTFEELKAEYGLQGFLQGLTAQQVLAQREKFGKNCLTPPNVIPKWLLYLQQYTNFFSLLLIAGGILCFIAYGIDQSDPSNLYLGVVLEVVVFISSTFAYVQEAKSRAIMDGFKSLIPKKCKAIRDGNATILDAVELVPGDVVEFQEGDQVPADLRIVDAYNLKVDNSSLTGESEACERVPHLANQGHMGDLEEGGGEEDGKPRKKGTPAIEASNLLFYSTIITSGHGRAVVIGTGDNTVMGQIAGLATETKTDDKPPIAREVDRFITIISAIAITIGIIFLSVGIGIKVMTVVQALVFAISVIVAVVPEGLLVTLTVALALTAKRMHHKHVLVKNLQSVETLGCTTVIASDKTGTLTQNRMTVQHAWYDDKLHDVPAPKNAVEFKSMVIDGRAANVTGPQGWQIYDPQAPTLQMLQRIATLCNNSDFVLEDKLDPSKGLLNLGAEVQKVDFNLLNLQTTGDASESGLIKTVQLLRDVKQYRAEYPKLFEIKFNSTNKYQIGIHDQTRDGNKRPLLLMKGAPERVWGLCSKILIDGKEVPVTEEWNAKFNTAYEALGALGERVLGFAYANLDLPHDHPWTDQPRPNFPIKDLTFTGLFSLMDPPRDGVPEAVEKCKRASIQVFMVTGDHPITAQAIAKQVGIIDDEHLRQGQACVCTGDDIREIMAIQDEDKRDAAWDRVLSHKQIVFARVTPAHKLLIVENNQRHKRVVAVTGDGVNDAPALKKGDIGVSMGIAGKDVSKEAADMILMDDNFASIVNGVEEGRLIFDNLKKSITYTLTSKLPELSPFLLWIIMGLPLATTTILILAIDLGTDMIPAISFAYETREADIMSRAPRNAHTDHLVDLSLLLFTYLHIGFLQALAGWYGYFVTMNDYGYPPWTLVMIGLTWDDMPLQCRVGDAGQPSKCGYGCEEWKWQQQNARIATAVNAAGGNVTLSALDSATTDWCKSGCDATRADPFSEFAVSSSGIQGFRGFWDTEEAVCGRTCAWWQGLTEAKLAEYRAARNEPYHPLRNILTDLDEQMFTQYCSTPGASAFGFPGRKAAFDRTPAPVGGTYWWGHQEQALPNMRYQRNILSQAQTAYFVAVVMNKVAAALICKTRKLSLLKQGVRNNRFMLFGFVFEAIIAVLITYVPPLNTVFNTGPLYGTHWLMGIPWFFLNFAYDEPRKWLMRKFPGGFVERITYW